MAFFEQMRNFFVFFIFSGLWFSWNNFEHKLIRSVSSILSIAFSFICVVSAVFFNRFLEFNSLSNTITNFLFVLYFVTHFVIIIESRIKNQSQMELIQKFTFIDHIFYTKLSKRVPYEREKKQIFTRMTILISIEFCINVMIIAAAHYLNFDFTFLYFSLYPNFLIFLRPIQVLFFTNLLLTRLKLINKELIDIQNIQNNNLQHSETVIVLHNANEGLSIYERLLSLKQIYRALFQACEQISMIFGWSILIIVINMFALFTFELYWAYMSLTNTARMFICIVYCVPIVVACGVLSWYCSSCSQEVCDFSFNSMELELKLNRIFNKIKQLYLSSRVMWRNGYIAFLSIPKTMQ